MANLLYLSQPVILVQRQVYRINLFLRQMNDVLTGQAGVDGRRAHSGPHPKRPKPWFRPLGHSPNLTRLPSDMWYLELLLDFERRDTK
jgi:hypothetical protein